MGVIWCLKPATATSAVDGMNRLKRIKQAVLLSVHSVDLPSIQAAISTLWWNSLAKMHIIRADLFWVVRTSQAVVCVGRDLPKHILWDMCDSNVWQMFLFRGVMSALARRWNKLHKFSGKEKIWEQYRYEICNDSWEWAWLFACFVVINHSVSFFSFHDFIPVIMTC